MTLTKEKILEHHALTDACPFTPDESGSGTHECLAAEMRCAYCGVRLDPYPCNGCGKFITAKEMSGYGGGTRCTGCA